MTSSLEQDVDFYLVDGPGFTNVDAYAFLAGIGRDTSTLPPLTAAANEGHTGAMIALVPSDADLKRLALKGGEDRDQLHLTLLFLGEANEISSEAREQITAIARRYAQTAPIAANAFSVNVFNPSGDEPCIVMGVGNGGSELEDLRSNIMSAIRGMSGYALVEQHTPWVPHVTITYTNDMDVIPKLARRTGPVTFDKIRVAFAGEVEDIPLGEVLTAHANHDQNTHGNRYGKGDITPTSKPFTKDELSAHVKRVKAGIADAFKNGLDTKDTHRVNGVWTVERDKLHRQIVDDLYAQAASVPNEGRAIMSGGPAGAGKTTALKQLVNLNDYLTINPDIMKEELARRGLVPEIPGFADLSPMERSTLVHQESRRLASMMANRAQQDRKNIIYDTTMTSYTGTKDQIQELDAAGYSKISGIFVDVPYDVSVARTRARYAQEANDYRAGKGLGGRFLPTSALNMHFGQNGKSYAAGTFNSLRTMFDAYVDYDNSGSKPKLSDGKGDIS